MRLVLPLCLGLLPCPSLAASFVAASSGLPPSNAGFDCSRINPGGWAGVDFADVDGDGDEDLAAVGRLLTGAHVWLSDGAGNWAEWSAGLDSDCHGRSDLEFADIDGDGVPDLGLVADINGPPAAFKNLGASWTPASTGLGGGPGEGFTFGDFDGDGKTDLAIVGHFSGGTQAAFGDGAGNWAPRSAGLTTDLGGHHIVAGDLDGDGADELISTQFFDPAREGVPIFQWDADAEGWILLALLPFNQPDGVAVGDANNDGFPDVIVGVAQDFSGTMGSIHVFLNDGDGRSFVESSGGLPVQAHFYGDVAVADFDGDGNLDIVAGDWSGLLQVFLGDGTGLWREEMASGLPFLGDKIEGLGVGDLDGDCRIDIGVAAYRAGVHAFQNQTSIPCPILPRAGSWRTICAGESTTLDASGSRACGCAAGLVYRWWDGGALVRDWDPAPSVDVSPATTRGYRLDVACAADLTCFISDVVAVTVGSDSGPPPALGNVLKLVKQSPAGVDFRWTDLAATVSDYEILSLPVALGPPTQAIFDGPLPTIIATATPGFERASRADAQTTPPGLVFFRVRATGGCDGAAKGPA